MNILAKFHGKPSILHIPLYHLKRRHFLEKMKWEFLPVTSSQRDIFQLEPLACARKWQCYSHILCTHVLGQWANNNGKNRWKAICNKIKIIFQKRKTTIFSSQWLKNRKFTFLRKIEINWYLNLQCSVSILSPGILTLPSLVSTSRSQF